jgi:hypothetical protein
LADGNRRPSLRHLQLASPPHGLDLSRSAACPRDVRVTLTNCAGYSAEEADSAELRQGIADLQVLYDAFLQSTNDAARLHMAEFSITDDPSVDARDNFFLDVYAPTPSGDFGQTSWSVEISRWVPDDPDDEFGDASSEPVLECSRSTPPGVDEIVNLLNLSAGSNDQLAAWTKTPIGEPLAGTSFVVTTRRSA